MISNKQQKIIENIKQKNKTQQIYDYFTKIAYPKYENCFLQIIDFMSLKENKNLRLEQNKYYLKAVLANCNMQDKREILFNIFVNSIKAVSQSKLNNQGKGVKDFIDYVNKLKKFNFENLFHNKEPINFISSFNGMGNKTAALFLRDLEIYKNQIFEDSHLFTKDYLKIPVDIVIVIMLNKIFHLPKEYKLVETRDFNFINNFFKEKLQKNFMIIEDFWFWGYFNLIANNKNGDRIFKFNEEKYLLDIFSFGYQDREIKKAKLKKFVNKFEKYIN